MLLANLLNAKTILHLSGSLRKTEIYELLVQRICQKTELSLCESKLLEMVLKRDEQGSTAYPSGIAIPHIRVEDFHDTVVGMAFLENAVEIEGTPVNWVALIITDLSSSNIYLNLVAALLRLSKDRHLINQLIGLGDGAAVLNYLKKAGIEIKKELNVSDIMNSEPLCIRQDESLSELSDILSQKDISFVPVIDEQGIYLGLSSLLQLLKVGVPDYLMMLDDLSFLSSYEPLEKLFEQQDEISVAQIMKTDSLRLAPDTSIPEAVFKMIQQKQNFFPVVAADGRLLGVISARDIFSKIIKA